MSAMISLAYVADVSWSYLVIYVLVSSNLEAVLTSTRCLMLLIPRFTHSFSLVFIDQEMKRQFPQLRQSIPKQ